jgi:hypothetical protein
MQFTLSFLLNFGLSFAGYLLIGIALCHGSWRNRLRTPFDLAAALIIAGHLFAVQGNAAFVVSVFGAVVLAGYYISRLRRSHFKPVDVREGHNIFSLLVGAALFALTVQLHALLFGVAVFKITG